MLLGGLREEDLSVEREQCAQQLQEGVCVDSLVPQALVLSSSERGQSFISKSREVRGYM